MYFLKTAVQTLAFLAIHGAFSNILCPANVIDCLTSLPPPSVEQREVLLSCVGTQRCLATPSHTVLVHRCRRWYARRWVGCSTSMQLLLSEFNESL